MKPDLNTLEFSWVTDFAELRQYSEEWAQLCASTGADIYLTPDWLDVWWQNFGAGRSLVCLIARDSSGVLVGLLPFMIDKVRVGLFRIKIARLAATDPHAVVFSVPVVEGCLERMLQKAARDILVTNALADVISFTPASALGTILPAIQSGSIENAHFTVHDRIQGSHTVFELPSRFEDYLATLSKKRRGQFRRDLRRLEEDLDLTTRLVYPNKCEFEEFAAFHNAQWQNAGHGGHFSDWRGSAAFYGDLSDRVHDKGWVWLEHMSGSQGDMATQFCLVTGQTCHWRLPARSTAPEYAGLSLGKLGLILMIRRLIGEGVTRIEAGVGSYSYKQIFGATEVPVHRLIIAPRNLFSRVRLSFLLAWERVLHLGYYRLWFGRLSLRLGKVFPMKRRPLWQSWIRSRV